MNNFTPTPFKTIDKIHYCIEHGGAYLVGNGSSYFETYEDAVAYAIALKYDTKNHNPNMSDENIEHWSKEIFTIEKVTTKVELLIKI